jgi:hypothetical protein
MSHVPRSPRDLVMGSIAGQAALAVQPAAQALYEAGGREILAAAAQVGLQKVVTGTTSGTVAAVVPALLAPAAQEAAVMIGPRLVRELTGKATTTAVAMSARTAGGQILRTGLRAGAVGLVVDAAFGAVQGVRAYRRGEMTGKEACVHTAVEAGTGAVSTTAGVLLAAGAIALTGGLAGTAVMAIGAGGAIATKLGLGRLLRRDRPAHPVPSDTPPAPDPAAELPN